MRWALRASLAAALIISADPVRADDEADAAESAAPAAAEPAPDDPTTSRIDDALAQIGAVVSPIPRMPEFGNLLGYAGADGWRHGGSGYAGADWTQGLFALRLFASDGRDDFKTIWATSLSQTARASLLPGLRLQAGKLEIKLFAGGDYLIRIPLHSNDAAVQKLGGRATLDAWWEFAEDWMVSGAVSATTIESGVSGRIASGYRVASAWIGPEAIVIRDVYSTQWRAGAHVSGVKIGMTEWSLAGGYVQDSFGRNSPYARLGVTLRP